MTAATLRAKLKDDERGSPPGRHTGLRHEGGQDTHRRPDRRAWTTRTSGSFAAAAVALRTADRSGFRPIGDGYGRRTGKGGRRVESLVEAQKGGISGGDAGRVRLTIPGATLMITTADGA